MNKRGAALMFSYMVMTVLTILGVGFIARSVSEKNLLQRHAEAANAFWASEAGAARALVEMRAASVVTTGTDLWSGTLPGQGRYSVDVESAGVMYKVTIHGYYPDSGEARIERKIEAMMSKATPSDFFSNAIYSAGDVDFNGIAYSVTGDIIYADDIDNPDNVTGSVTQDPNVSPLARFDFQELYDTSSTQGNVYDTARLQDVQDGTDTFPASFWFTPPTDPMDPATGVPNVVYVEDDLQLNGNIGTIGGFFVVVGDVLSDPDAEDPEDAVLNGNGTIEGTIYTLGEFRINGGGGNLNINGGVWAGEEARLNGNAHVEFNSDYMDAIQSLDIETEVQIVNWRDTQNPYKTTY